MLLASSVSGLFKWRQFEPEVILLAVGWYLRFSLSYRDVEELLAERGLHADHVTVWRWVQRYAPEMERRLRSRFRPTNESWRVDETYIRVKGKWVYLYRAVDSSGATIDFLLSAKRDAAAAERFLAKALGGENHPAPRVINTDEHAGYPRAIERLKATGALEENCRHRPAQYLNNVLEQDHRAIKRRVRASQHFRSFWGAWRTIAGYEAMHMIRRPSVLECGVCFLRNSLPPPVRRTSFKGPAEAENERPLRPYVNMKYNNGLTWGLKGHLSELLDHGSLLCNLDLSVKRRNGRGPGRRDCVGQTPSTRNSQRFESIGVSIGRG